MSGRGSPEMSVIIITPDRYETIRETMNHLRAQTARHRLEIVIVAPSTETLDLDTSELEGFFGFVSPRSAKSSRWAKDGRLESARQARQW